MPEKIRNFKLKDHNRENFQLAHCSGKKVLLSFHPLAWTPVCARQMQALDSNWKLLDTLGTIAVGLSIDTVPCKEAWAKSLEIRHTKLLCDFWPHGKVAKSLGLFRDMDGFSERANILLNEKGEIIFMKVYPLRELPDLEEIILFLKEREADKNHFDFRTAGVLATVGHEEAVI